MSLFVWFDSLSRLPYFTCVCVYPYLNKVSVLLFLCGLFCFYLNLGTNLSGITLTFYPKKNLSGIHIRVIKLSSS